MVLMLSLMFLCASLRASALSDGHEAEPQVDTLNILGSDSQHFDSVADGSDEDGSLAFLRRRHKGKVEGTLTYKKGWDIHFRQSAAECRGREILFLPQAGKDLS